MDFVIGATTSSQNMFFRAKVLHQSSLSNVPFADVKA
jgi:hypothetical protein